MALSVTMVVIGLLCIVLNPQLSQGAKEWQQILGNEYSIWSFRLPLYVVGAMVIVIGLLRIFDI